MARSSRSKTENRAHPLAAIMVAPAKSDVLYQCPGCKTRPHRLCCACGEPAVVATFAASDHSFSWCYACFATLCQVRVDAAQHPQADVTPLHMIELAS